MLYLVFDIGDHGYALAASEIIEMLPFIEPRPVRGAPMEVAGSIGYRGRYLPVIDLTAVELGRPAELRIGTRIAVVSVRVAERLETVGLILENATEMLRCDSGAFTPFAKGPRGLVQRLDLRTLVPSHLLDRIAWQSEGAL